MLCGDFTGNRFVVGMQRAGACLFDYLFKMEGKGALEC